jgi:hypothetical protein
VQRFLSALYLNPQGEKSVKQIRKRVTYANVMSSIAVFLVLGGASAYAAKKIGSNEIKGNSITTGKIKKEAVSASKIKKNAVTTAKIANGAVTGAKLNLGTVGTVPNAAHATTADTASNANAVNGLHLSKIAFTAGPNTPDTAFFSAAGLTLRASCDAGEEINVTGTTSVNNSEIYESGNYLEEFDGGYDDDFDIGDTELVGENIGDASQQEVQGQLVYSTPAGAVVTIEFSINENGTHGDTQPGCAFDGIAQFS